jgi:hypothetical protein
MAMKNPAPTPSTNSAYRVSGMIDPSQRHQSWDFLRLDLGSFVAPRR